MYYTDLELLSFNNAIFKLKNVWDYNKFIKFTKFIKFQNNSIKVYSL